MPHLTNTKLRANWEKRANNAGISLASVLLRNFPPILNHYLHEWHVDLIQRQLLPYIPDEGKLLDVASGYGRVSIPIQAARPDIQLLGVDFAYPYCQHYITNVKMPAICASIYDLPFPFDFLDGIVGITALMYVKDGQEQIVFNKLVQQLKPGGYAFLLDPGVEFLTLASTFIHSQASTSGKGFTQKDYMQFGQTGRTKVIASGGYPIFSTFIPFLYGISSKNQHIVHKLLHIIKKLDKRAEKHHKFTLHRWMLVKRNH